MDEEPWPLWCMLMVGWHIEEMAGLERPELSAGASSVDGRARRAWRAC